MTRKSKKDGRKPAWLNKKLLSKPEHRKEVYRRWKKSNVIQEEYKDTVRACSVRKAKTHLEYSLVRGVKANKKGFCRHISIKRKSRENVGVLLNRVEELVTKDIEKSKLLSAFFTSVFTDHIFLQEPEAAETSWKYRARKSYP